MAIVIYHFRHYSPYPWFENFPVLRLGFLGVDFFFVLSGLVICHVYLDKFLAGRERIFRFLVLRISRLLPVHALMMTVLLACAIATGRVISAQEIFDWISLTFLVRQWLLPDAMRGIVLLGRSVPRCLPTRSFFPPWSRSLVDRIAPRLGCAYWALEPLCC